MIEKTALSCGVDIPFIKAQLVVHPPKLKEIAMIGEKNFFIGCEMLNSQKKDLEKKGNFDLDNLTNFDIIMSVMNEKSAEAREQKNVIKQVLALIFPKYEIYYAQDQILFVQEENTLSMNKENFEDFQKIITDLFMLDKRNKEENQVYRPADDTANAIAEKLYKAREKVAKQKGEDTEFFVLGKYADVLSVGLHKDRNIFNEYTVWQLYSEFDRFMAKYNWDINLKCRLAGATKVDEVENWIK